MTTSRIGSDASHVFPGWPVPTNLKWRQIRGIELAGIERFHQIWESRFENLRAIRAWEAGQGWHLSIPHPSRYPTWNEIRDARYDLLPDSCTMAMLLPPRAEYVNLHPNCFHLHEVAA